MLLSFGRSFPFLFLRIILVLCEGATLYFGSIYVHDYFMVFMSGHVEGLFLKMLSPMGYLVGLGVSAATVKYAFGLVQYYFKLAHIIYLTMLILDYNPSKTSRFLHALLEAMRNFSSLVINDFTTRGVVKALNALKDAILNIDLLSKFKEPESSIVKFVKAVCTTGLKNVINMTDEIIVSYTWFTNDLYLANLERQNKPLPTIKEKIKHQATFMLEGMAFTVRVLPQLMLSSLIFEVGLFILVNILAVSTVVFFISYLGFKFVYLVWAAILYRTLIHILYYIIVESMRLNVYLYSFYSELEELEPFNIKETLADLLGKVPLLKPLIKRSGQRITPTGTEGSPILEGDLNTILRENVNEVASAFNLNTADLLDADQEPDTQTQESESTEQEPVPQEDVDEAEVEEDLTESPTEIETTPEPAEQTPDEDVISDDEIIVDVDPTPSPFDNNRVERNRR